MTYPVTYLSRQEYKIYEFQKKTIVSTLKPFALRGTVLKKTEKFISELYQIKEGSSLDTKT